MREMIKIASTKPTTIETAVNRAAFKKAKPPTLKDVKISEKLQL